MRAGSAASWERSVPVGRAVSVVAVLLAAAVLAWLVAGALESLWWTGPALLGPRLRALLVVALVLPAVVLLAAVVRRRRGIAWQVYWLWAFVFMGLAPVYQISTGRFPWQLVAEETTLTRALGLVLLGHVAVLAGAWWAGRARGLRREEPAAREAEVGGRALSGSARVISWAIVAQVAVSVAFVAVMGPGNIVSGRAVFSARLVEVGALLGGGTLYFLATSLAVLVPAVAVGARRAGGAVPLGLIAAGCAAGFVVTNPLVGSRFLSGAFLVSVVGALVGGGRLAALLPSGVLVVLVVVFPSLDLWRGDGTGASGVAVTSPDESLVTFDFDSFEMLTRAVVYTDAGGVPSPLLSAVAPLVRWVPGLSNLVVDSASGTLVARGTGMGYTNVSMPLWAEGYLVAGTVGTFALLGLLGVWLGVLARPMPGTGDGRVSALFDASTAALLFIVLRGSLYEVLGYLLVVVAAFGVLAFRSRSRDRAAGDGPVARPVRHAAVRP